MDLFTAETSGDDTSEKNGSATSGTEDAGSSPQKRRGRKRKRGSSTSEAEISDGRRRKKENMSESDGQKDRWTESDGDELSSMKGESPQKGKFPHKGKSPKGQTARISFVDSDDECFSPETSTLARSEDEETVSLKRKRMGRPKKSVIPEEDVTAWRSFSDDAGRHDDHHHGDGVVSDVGASMGDIGQVNTGVQVEKRKEVPDPVSRSPQKKVLLGLKKTRSRKDPEVEESEKGSGSKEQIVEGGVDVEVKGVEKTPEKMRKGEEMEGQMERSPRKSARPRKVVKY